MCKCGARWTGAKMAHCGSCHLTFSTVSNFDRHRAGTVERRRCLTPTEAGLRVCARGVLRLPGADEGTPED